MGIVNQGWETYKDTYLHNAPPDDVEKAKHTFYHSTRLLVTNIVQAAKENRLGNIQNLIIDDIVPDMRKYQAQEKDKAMNWFMETVLPKEFP